MWSHPHRIDYLYESESIDNNKFWSRLFKFKKGVRLNRENGGKDYWYEKLAELSVDLKQTILLLDRAKSAKPMQEIKEEDL